MDLGRFLIQKTLILTQVPQNSLHAHNNDNMNKHKPGVPLLDQAILKDDNVYAGHKTMAQRIHK